MFYKLRIMVAIAILTGVALSLHPHVSAEPALSKYPPELDAATRKRIEMGLRYLEARQRSDGSWVAESGDYPVAITSLVGLSFMASGSTPESGPYSKVVKKAQDYILKVARKALKHRKYNPKHGLLISAAGDPTHKTGHPMYGHGFSMLFLAQCYGVSSKKPGDKIHDEIKNILQKAVRMTQYAQSDLGQKLKHAGGWDYTPGTNTDEGSVTVTQLQALRACRNVGIKVNKKTILRAVYLLTSIQNQDGGIRYRSSVKSGPSQPALSAAAIVSFYMSGVYDRKTGGKGSEAKMVDKLVKYCRGHTMPKATELGHYFYTQLFMAQAMYQRGGKDWAVYFPIVKTKFAELQAADGSWPGDTTGQVYGTAIGCLILQLPYGYLPIIQR